MSTDAFEQLIDVAAPGGGSYPVQRGHRRGVRSPHTFDAARWPPSSLTSPYAPQGSTTAVLKIIKGGCYRNRPNSSPVLTRKPRRSPGRYCIRFRRPFTRAVSSARVCLVRLASDRFRCDHTGSTGLSSWA